MNQDPFHDDHPDDPEYRCAVIACLAVAGSNPANLVEGSEQVPCYCCQAPVWLSPHYQTTVDEVRPVCIACLTHNVPTNAHFGISDASRAELRRRGITDQQIDFVRAIANAQLKDT